MHEHSIRLLPSSNLFLYSKRSAAIAAAATAAAVTIAITSRNVKINVNSYTHKCVA